jgi:hypothetical protein
MRKLRQAENEKIRAGWKDMTTTGDYIDQRSLDLHGRDPYFKPHLKRLTSKTFTFLDVFEDFLPLDHIRDYLVYNLNLAAQGSADMKKAGWHPTNSEEYKLFIGIILGLSVTTTIGSRRDHWARDAGPFLGAPHIGSFMSRARFELLICCHKYMAEMVHRREADEHSFLPLFIEAFNQNMERALGPGWIFCLDEGMFPWTGEPIVDMRYISCKPDPRGHEIKMLACAQSRVIVRMEVCKSGPAQAGRLHDELGATIGYMMRLLWDFRNKGYAVVVDSYFSMSGTKMIAAMRAIGVYVLAMVKKHRYWPYGIPADLVEQLENFAGSMFAKSQDINGVLMFLYGLRRKLDGPPRIMLGSFHSNCCQEGCSQNETTIWNDSRCGSE